MSFWLLLTIYHMQQMTMLFNTFQNGTLNGKLVPFCRPNRICFLSARVVQELGMLDLEQTNPGSSTLSAIKFTWSLPARPYLASY